MIYSELAFNIKIKEIINIKTFGNKTQFCLETGIKKITLYKILSGENIKPNYETIFKIKKAYPDINLNWLLYDDIEKFTFKEKTYKMIIKELEKEIERKNIIIDYLKNIK
jgi:predicted transcriptional regulator